MLHIRDSIIGDGCTFADMPLGPEEDDGDIDDLCASFERLPLTELKLIASPLPPDLNLPTTLEHLVITPGNAQCCRRSTCQKLLNHTRTALSRSLPKLQNLTHLDFEYPDVAPLDLSHLVNLQYLDLHCHAPAEYPMHIAFLLPLM